MIKVNDVKILLMESEYPYFSEETLTSLCDMYEDINELCYIACTMKAKAEKIKVGPIEIDSNSDMWNNLASIYYRKFIESSNTTSSTSRTGLMMRRADD